MSNRSTTHSTFVIERNYDASPARVFAAWADVNAKAQLVWARAAGKSTELDFREGGREHFVAAVVGAAYATTRSTKTSSRTSGSSTPTTCTAMGYGCPFR